MGKRQGYGCGFRSVVETETHRWFQSQKAERCNGSQYAQSKHHAGYNIGSRRWPVDTGDWHVVKQKENIGDPIHSVTRQRH